MSHNMQFRFPTTEEWDNMMDIVHEDNSIAHWEDIFSWVCDLDFEQAHPLHRAVRGYVSARYWRNDYAAYQGVSIGFRPAFDVLGSKTLSSCPKDGERIVIGTLYMNGKPVKVPQNPVWAGDIADYVPGAALTFEPALNDSDYAVTAIKVGDVYIADRVLLKTISYRDIKRLIAAQDTPSAKDADKPAKPIETNAVLFIDMDGTLAEWHAADAFEDLLEEGYFRSLAPYESVIETARQLQTRGVSVSTLSAYLDESDYALNEKRAWLDEHAPFITKSLFCPSKMTKPEVVRQRYGYFDKRCVLLDDYSENLHAWMAAGGTAIKLLNGINGTKGTWKGPAVSRFAPPEEIVKYIADILESISKEDAPKYDHRDDFLAGNYVLLYGRAILDDDRVEAFKDSDALPLAQFAVKRDWLERWLADSEYTSINAFLNGYTTKDTNELQAQAIFEDAVAFIYCKDIDEPFEFPTKCDGSAMLAFADFLSKCLQENGHEDASKYLDALLEL